MESKLVLYDNYRKNIGSFTYYLETRKTFNPFAFGSLCESISHLAETLSVKFYSVGEFFQKQ